MRGACSVGWVLIGKENSTGQDRTERTGKDKKDRTGQKEDDRRRRAG